jgi:membrane protein insertase Oxa1/YidC/SpoIIIJ
LHAPRISRLEFCILISMVGYLADWGITHWMVNSLTGFSESNMNLMPEIGLPILIINFIAADRILPRRAAYDRVIYTMSLLQWSGPLQNVLVLFNVVRGLDFFSAVLPFMGVTYLVLYLAPIVGSRLSLLSHQRLG